MNTRNASAKCHKVRRDNQIKKILNEFICGMHSLWADSSLFARIASVLSLKIG
jgi:hypothetical protein